VFPARTEITDTPHAGHADGGIGQHGGNSFGGNWFFNLLVIANPTASYRLITTDGLGHIWTTGNKKT